jgi:hypothetical protein
MENLGERLVGDYLRYVKKCDFVDFNVYTLATQGEIDVIGVSNLHKTAFICEVVTHLTTGIQYTKNARPDTADRLIKKFTKDIQYGKEAFAGWSVQYMLWSPVVKRSNGNPIYDQFSHLKRMTDEILTTTGVQVTLVVNKDYVDAIDKLREFAAAETKELKSPIMRFLQIDQWSRKNLKRLDA